MVGPNLIDYSSLSDCLALAFRPPADHSALLARSTSREDGDGWNCILRDTERTEHRVYSGRSDRSL